jgi:hypothetical protein
MKLIRKKFERSEETAKDGTPTFWDIDPDDSRKGFLCADRLAQYFEIPPEARRIWITLHNRPAKSRVSVRIPPGYFGDVVVEGRRREPIELNLFNRYLYPYIGRTVYAEVEYE